VSINVANLYINISLDALLNFHTKSFQMQPVNTMPPATMKMEASTKPMHTTSPGLDVYRASIVLIGYTVSTLLYSLAIRITPSSLLVTIPLCMLAFSIPDLMAIVLLKSPHPIMERFLLNLIGPLSSACVFLLLLR
jgi:hypothetical protein